MTVFITGATGHIGVNLVRALSDKNVPTRCLVHVNQKPLEGLNTEKVNGDVRDLDSLCRAFEGIDTVYYLAGHISLSMDGWPDLEETNVVGTRNVGRPVSKPACAGSFILVLSTRSSVNRSPIPSMSQIRWSIPPLTLLTTVLRRLALLR